MWTIFFLEEEKKENLVRSALRIQSQIYYVKKVFTNFAALKNHFYSIKSIQKDAVDKCYFCSQKKGIQK